MKRPGFFQGVLVAAAFALFAGAAAATFAPFVGLAGVLRLIAPLTVLAYFIYMFRSSRARTGRIVTIALWAVVTVVAWWSAPPLAIYLMIQAAALWLVRSVYRYAGIVPAVLDFGLTAVGAMVFTWALLRSGSVFLATWCFFLVQALWVAIPARIRGRQQFVQEPPDDASFQHARRQADQALRHLFSRQG